MKKQLPETYRIMKEEYRKSEMYTHDWFFSFFARDFDLKIARAFWDVIFSLGDFYFIKIALAVFHLLEEDIKAGREGQRFNCVKSRVNQLDLKSLMEKTFSEPDLKVKQFSVLLARETIK